MSMAVQPLDQPLRIMFADDDIHICETMHKFFEGSSNFKVVGCVHNGAEVLDRLNEWKPDILLTDIVMPYKDGMDVLEELQNIPHHDAAIFVLSAVSNEQTMRHVMDLGIVYYFVKPFPLALLCNRILQLYLQRTSVRLRISTDTPQPILQPNAQDSSPKHAEMAQRLQRQAADLLHEVGVPPHLSGYRYLLDAICMTVDQAGLTGQMTKQLYPAIAQRHQSTGVRVERSVRHAVEVAFSRCKVETLEKLFGYTVSDIKGKPTNGEFIAMMADKIRLSPGNAASSQRTAFSGRMGSNRYTG